MKFNYFIILLFAVLLSASCSKPDTPPVVPKLSFDNYSYAEGTGGQANVSITLTLSQSTTNEVSLTWLTEDGTAKAGSDYTAVTNGVLKFAPGETSKTIDIQVNGDSNFEFNEDFYVKITSINNATLMGSKITVTLENDDTYTPEFASDGCITPNSYPDFTLAWADEFEGSALNTSWWNYEKGGGGWGNNELEVYTDAGENSFVQNGVLTIRATKNATTGGYNSARLTTKGKKEFTYGRIDIRAKLPKGKGIWPALWMLGANINSVPWPACGEIDIMELLGDNIYKTYGTVHYDNSGHQSTGGNYLTTSPDNFNDKFHVFSLMWQPTYMEFYVDYHKYFTVRSSAIKYTAFNLPQFFIFNVAVGGNWPGNPDNTTVFPQDMVVDYIRIFQ